ncbi:MAG: caspase family protein [Desulfobacterales bacterium]|nr:caspase family protein [Desulfobacterales bacterium]
MKTKRFLQDFIIFSVLLLLFSCSSKNYDYTESIKMPEIKIASEVAKGIKQQGDIDIALEPSKNFKISDESVASLIRFKNLSGSHYIQWKWYVGDSLYSESKRLPIGIEEGKVADVATVWHKISLKGVNPYEIAGKWKVQVYFDNELKCSDDFEVKGQVFQKSDVDIDIPKGDIPEHDGIAVVIGNSSYLHLPPVAYAHHDAQVIKEYLIKTLKYKEENIIFKLDLSNKTDFDSLFGGKGEYNKSELARKVIPQKSDIFIYYSGHGIPDTDNKKDACLVPIDYNSNDSKNISYKAYSLGILYENIGSLNAKSITVVLDSCFSGKVSSDEKEVHIIPNASPVMMVTDIKLAKGMNILCSSDGDQISNWYPEKQHGIFTYFFLKAIQGHADKNNDKEITFKEIEDYISGERFGVPSVAYSLYKRNQNPFVSPKNNDKIFVKLD